MGREILESLLTSEWNVLSDNMDLDILPLEQERRLEVKKENNNIVLHTLKSNGYLIFLIVSIVITCLLVFSLIFITRSYWRNSYCSKGRSPVLRNDSGSSSYPPHISLSQPQRFGTVGRKLRPISQPVSGFESFDWLRVT